MEHTSYHGDSTEQQVLKYGQALTATLLAFDVLEKKAGWFERLQIRLLRITYRQRLRHLVVSLPSEVAEKILKGDKI